MIKRIIEIDNYFYILLFSPVVILLINNQWLYNPNGIDCWLYYGYFQNYPDHISIFKNTYYGTRLSYIIPGYVVYKLFPPIAATYVLHLMYWYASVFLCYFILKSFFERKLALFVSLLIGLYAPFLRTTGTDYFTGPSITYWLLLFFFLAGITKSPHKKLPLIGCGVSYALLVHSNIYSIIFTPAFIVFLLLSTKLYTKDYLVYSAKYIFFGAAGITIILCCINFLAGGVFLFFLPSFFWSTGTIHAFSQSNPYAVNSYRWLLFAPWLIIPIITLFCSFIMLIINYKNRSKNSIAYLLVLSFVISFMMLIGWELKWRSCLVYVYYANYLIPSMFLAIGAIFYPCITNLKKSSFICLVSIEMILLLLSLSKPFISMFPHYDNNNRYLFYTPLFMPLFTLLGFVLFLTTRYVSMKLSIFFLLFFCFVNFLNITEANTYLSMVPHKRTRDNFLSIYRGMEAVRKFDPDGSTYFWYGRESLVYIFQGIASTYLWQYRLISNSFPKVEFYNTLQNIEINRKIAILSEKKNAFELANNSLKELGLQGIFLQKKEIESGEISFSITFIKLESLPPDEIKMISSHELFTLNRNNYGTLEQNIYGKIERFKKFINRNTSKVHLKERILLEKTKDNFYLFDSKFSTEHLATPYYTLTHTEPDQEIWLKITFAYSEEHKPAPYVFLVIQDGNFNEMFSLPCYDPYEPLKEPTKVLYFKILREIEKIRVIFYNKKAEPSYLPENITVDQCILNQESP